ncbi:MAG: amino acid--tRNA ligase-related protein [Pseudomonadota bacterium]|nr:amino acid--tRNA ligase-related protein [Pseudomonadota bacterium]
MSDWRPLASIEHLKQRAELLAQARAFLAGRDVIEVQIPALAKDSVTEPDVQSIEVPGYGYLQTSPEYQMKRLLAAGMPSCYQLGPAFRHGEQGMLHNPEFTMLEWYRLGFDHNQLMYEVADLVDVLLGPKPYQRLTYEDVVGKSKGRRRDALDLAFAKACERLTPGRFFITDYPADQAALARINPDGQTAARFELVIDGIEIANGYWELLNADEHRQRFKTDSEIRQQRGLPAMALDEAFLAALEHGLPECAGVALGFDRLVMLGVGAKALSHVTAFRGS